LPPESCPDSGNILIFIEIRHDIGGQLLPYQQLQDTLPNFFTTRGIQAQANAFAAPFLKPDTFDLSATPAGFRSNTISVQVLTGQFEHLHPVTPLCRQRIVHRQVQCHSDELATHVETNALYRVPLME
jgi:hypothetical protein